jgi:hypothetical protein
MAERPVHEVGQVVLSHNAPLRVGVDYDTVSLHIGDRLCTITLAQAEEFARLFVSAVWQAGQQKARLAESDAAKGAFDMAPGMPPALPPRTCTCGQWPHDQRCPALDDR